MLVVFGLFGCRAESTVRQPTQTPASTRTDKVEESAGKWAALESYIGRYGSVWGETYAFSGCIHVRDASGGMFERCYGLADRPSGRTNTPQTVVRIASLTKQFTAAAVLTLVDRGRVELSDGICDHISPCSARYQNVTLHHLLSHTSGIPNYTNFEDYNDEFKGRAQTPQQLYAYFSARDLSFEPGTKFEYSNSGYALLGMLIESVSGQSYGEYLAEALFRPAGLKATAYAPSAQRAGAASGYHPDHDEQLIQTHHEFSLSAGFSAGGMVSTLEDLVRWDEALRQDRVLSEESRALLFSPNLEQYGYGWSIHDLQGRRFAEHSGQVSGFSTNVVRALDGEELVVVLANNDQFGASGLAEVALAVMDGREPPPYREEQLSPLDEVTQRAVAGTYRLDPESRAQAIEAGILASDLDSFESIEIRIEDGELRFLWVRLRGTASGALVVPRWGMYFRPTSRSEDRVTELVFEWGRVDLRYARTGD